MGRTPRRWPGGRGGPGRLFSAEDHGGGLDEENDPFPPPAPTINSGSSQHSGLRMPVAAKAPPVSPLFRRGFVPEDGGAAENLGREQQYDDPLAVVIVPSDDRPGPAGITAPGQHRGQEAFRAGAASSARAASSTHGNGAPRGGRGYLLRSKPPSSSPPTSSTTTSTWGPDTPLLTVYPSELLNSEQSPPDLGNLNAVLAADEAGRVAECVLELLFFELLVGPAGESDARLTLELMAGGGGRAAPGLGAEQGAASITTSAEVASEGTIASIASTQKSLVSEVMYVGSGGAGEELLHRERFRRTCTDLCVCYFHDDVRGTTTRVVRQQAAVRRAAAQVRNLNKMSSSRNSTQRPDSSGAAPGQLSGASRHEEDLQAARSTSQYQHLYSTGAETDFLQWAAANQDRWTDLRGMVREYPILRAVSLAPNLSAVGKGVGEDFLFVPAGPGGPPGTAGEEKTRIVGKVAGS